MSVAAVSLSRDQPAAKATVQQLTLAGLTPAQVQQAHAAARAISMAGKAQASPHLGLIDINGAGDDLLAHVRACVHAAGPSRAAGFDHSCLPCCLPC
jgi:hypothetical protein